MPWNKDGTRKKSVLYKKQKFGEAISPFVMKGRSPFTQKEKPIVAEAVSTSVAKPITPTVIGEPVDPHYFPKGYGYSAKMTKLKKKAPKKNILTSFTDFIKSKKTKQ